MQVEECLIFCHDRISQIVASPCNMGCINNRLLARYVCLVSKTSQDHLSSAIIMKTILVFTTDCSHRLAEKFTPLELEGITDRKDKIKR